MPPPVTRYNKISWTRFGVESSESFGKWSVVLQASTRTGINKVLTRLTLCRSRVAAPERCVTFFTSQTRVPVSEAAAGRSPRARVPLEAVPERTRTPHGVNRTAAELMK